jgi:hypothetical protein
MIKSFKNTENMLMGSLIKFMISVKYNTLSTESLSHAVKYMHFLALSFVLTH